MVKKERLTVTIDKDVDTKLSEYTEASMIAKSKIVNEAIKKYLEDKDV